jgi:hypothetical protein
MKIVVSKVLPPKGYVAMMLWPFLIVRREYDPVSKRTLNHEMIHAAQQKETGIVLFCLWYGVEYVIRRLRYRSHNRAYRSICFEAEAYANDGDMGYLERRRFWGFWGYL